MKRTMPKVNWQALSHLSDSDRSIVERFVKADGTIRKTRPTLPKRIKVDNPNSTYGYTWEYANQDDSDQGIAAYVWRHVVFAVSPERTHQCMPCNDIAYLPSGDVTVWHSVLSVLINDVIDAVPRDQWHGVKRWGQALGQIGSPAVRDDGSIVYR